MKKACYQNRRSMIDSCSKRILPTVTQRYSNYTDALYPYQSISFRIKDQSTIHKEHLSLPKVKKNSSKGAKEVQKRNKYQKILFQKMVVKQRGNKQYFDDRQILEQFQRTAYLRLKMQKKKKHFKQTFYDSVQAKKISSNTNNFENQIFLQKPAFRSFIDLITKEVQQKKKYHHIINKEHILGIISKTQQYFIEPKWGILIVELILQYLQYSEKQTVALFDKNIFKHLQFIRSFGKRISFIFGQIERYTQRIFTTLMLFRLDVNPLSQKNSFYVFRLNFDLQKREIQKILQIMKMYFNNAQKICLLLSFYLYKSCLQLEKRHVSIVRVEQKLKQALTIIQNCILLNGGKANNEENQEKQKEVVKKIRQFQFNALQLGQVQKSERQKLIDQCIQENIMLAIQNYQYFTQIINGIHQKNQTLTIRQDSIFEAQNMAQSISIIKRKLLANQINKSTVHQFVKMSSRMPIHTLVRREQELVDEQIKIICQQLEDTLVFDIDLITTTVICQDVKQIETSCAQLKDQMSKFDQKQVMLIAIKTSRPNSVTKVYKQFKLSIFNTLVSITFILRHQHYPNEIQNIIASINGSKLFTPLTSLKIFHEQLVNIFLTEVNTIVRKKANKQNIIDTLSQGEIVAIQQQIKQGVSVSESSCKEPSIKYFTSITSRFHKIESIKTDKCYEQYELQQALNIAELEFQLKNFQSAINFYVYYSQIKERQFVRDQQHLHRMMKQSQILKGQFCHFLYCLDRLGLLFRLIGKLSESIVYYKRLLEYLQKYIKHDSYQYLKTLFTISCSYEAKNNREEAQIYRFEALKIINTINEGQNKQVYTMQQFVCEYEIERVQFPEYILK